MLKYVVEIQEKLNRQSSLWHPGAGPVLYIEFEIHFELVLIIKPAEICRETKIPI